MVADSLWRAAVKTLGNTVDGTSNYALPTDVVDIKRLKVAYTDGTVLYNAVGIEELWGVDATTGEVRSGVHVFAEDYQADGTVQVRLYPAPEESGVPILGLQALQPATMTYGGAFTPIIPADIHPYLLDGAFADGYAEVEHRPDLAQYHEQRFEVGVNKLRMRKNSRTGDGPARIAVQGYDF